MTSSDLFNGGCKDAGRVSRLEVRQLKTFFFLDRGILKAVDGVSFRVEAHETVGIIGESGCGKSITAQSLLRLIRPPGEIVAGEARLLCKDGAVVDILSLPANAVRRLRGNEMSIVFQEPMTSFSPVHTIGAQIGEMLSLHTDLGRADIRERVLEMLQRVGISNPGQRYQEYPHQLSGGMRQRAMIAMSLICNPQVLIADEPTTALDVTIQAQILELIRELQTASGMSAIYITHNMAVVAENVDRVYVMYLGRVVESASTERLFANPMHPYTQRLLRAIPRPAHRVDRLEVIEGSVPSAIDPPAACGFRSRCSVAIAGKCEVAVPELVERERGHYVRCFLHGDEKEPEDEWSAI